jgi:two-component system, OmpR family, response regulator MprA
MVTILVVDADTKLLNTLSHTLVSDGLRVVTASDGQNALAQVQTYHPDVIVLDWFLPALDGIGVVKDLRAADDVTPILMLTARDSVEDRVEGLTSGADDYMVKPFACTELLARVRALLRRTGVASQDRPMVYADLYLDPMMREVRRGPRMLDLTCREFNLLQYLMRYPCHVLRREHILLQVWGQGYSADVLEIYVRYLRKKTEAEGESRLIHSVRAVGYMLRET